MEVINVAKKGIFLKEEVGFKVESNVKKSQVNTKKPAKAISTKKK